MAVSKHAALLAVATVVIGLDTTGASQARDTPRVIRETRVKEWTAIVHEHEPGRMDEALRRLQGWSDTRLGELMQGLADAFGRPSQLPITTPEDRQRLLRRGATLHADLAMLTRYHENQTDIPTPGRLTIPSVIVDDGRTTGYAANSLHWEIGRALIDYSLIQPERPPDEFVSMWYRVAGEFMIAGADYAATAPHLRRARALLPDHAHVWLASGVVHASYAAPSVQNTLGNVRVPFGFTVVVDDRRTELDTAERLLRRAVQLAPEHSEARLRHGWVLVQQKRFDPAFDALQFARARSTEPGLQYYACLFLGVAHGAVGRPAVAADAFEQAARLFPTAQAPLLGLSELALRQGDRAAAAAALDRLFALPASGRDEPWWTYDVDYGRSWRTTLSKMYAWLAQVER